MRQVRQHSLPTPLRAHANILFYSPPRKLVASNPQGEALPQVADPSKPYLLDFCITVPGMAP